MDLVNNILFKLLGIVKYFFSSFFLVDVFNLRRLKFVLYLKFIGRIFFKGREMKENNFGFLKLN